MYPLREALFLVVCATIANCDDYEDIVDWGEANLDVLRGFCEFHFGAPCADWLRALMNRLDPEAFSAAFRARSCLRPDFRTFPSWSVLDR